MFISHPIDRSAHRRLTRVLARVLALSVFTTAACTDSPGPVGPSKVVVPELAPPAADIYPGTTNTEFFGVKVQGGATALSIKFDYTGIVTPAFTVGKGPDVLGTQVISVAAKKQAAGYWTATAGGLESGKLYYFRLDNMKSTYWSSAKTLRRDVTADLDSVYVSNDSDPGPGCGEWTVHAFLEDAEAPMFWDIGNRSFCSGNTYRFTGPGEGVRTFIGVTKSALLWFEVKETDNCFPYEYYCYEYNDTDPSGFDFYGLGKFTFDMSLLTIHRPRARFWGRISTAYNPW